MPFDALHILKAHSRINFEYDACVLLHISQSRGLSVLSGLGLAGVTRTWLLSNRFLIPPFTQYKGGSQPIFYLSAEGCHGAADSQKP